MSHCPDDYDLERSHELERRLDRDEEREPLGARGRRIRKTVVPPRPANANIGRPIIVLEPTGDGAALYRTLARVIVRREMKFAREISTETSCEAAKAA